jgi:uncharacterized protein with HEPN domain
LTIAFIDEIGCYNNEIDCEEFYSDPVEITTVKSDDVTGDASADVKKRNTETTNRLKWLYTSNLSDRLSVPEISIFWNPRTICIRHLIERLDDCHRELSNLQEKGSFVLNHSTRSLTRLQVFPKFAKMFEQ